MCWCQPDKRMPVCDNCKSWKINDNKSEIELLKSITEIWNKFYKLERYHPSELQEFSSAIHTLQQLLGMRILNREHPELFPRK